MTTIPIICVVGPSGVGKTTLLEKLIPVLKQRGYRIATIKHHGHPGFEIDIPGKDTWRHAQAGSDHVMIVGPDKVASIRSIQTEPSLDEVAATIEQVDLILAEGYKWTDKPKIEVIRRARCTESTCPPEQLVAMATDVDLVLDVPCFGLDDVADLAELIEAQFLQ